MGLNRMWLRNTRRSVSECLRPFSHAAGAGKHECKKEVHHRIPISHREGLKDAKRVMIKFGSSVILQPEGRGLAMSRLANLIEQMAHLHNHGKDVIFITSGGVALGRTKLALRLRRDYKIIEKQPASAVGQPGLMHLYDVMFARYDIQVAQILVTETDLYQDHNREVVNAAINKLLQYRVIPILNTNDVVLPQPDIPCPTLCKGISLKDNDSMSAMIASEIKADLLLILSTVDGVYTKDPRDPEAKLLHTFSEDMKHLIQYGEKNVIGLGGMDTKIHACLWAVKHGIAVVVCNGMKMDSIKTVLRGKKFGTFFVRAGRCKDDSTEQTAIAARAGGRKLRLLTGEQRAACIHKMAELLDQKIPLLMEANKKDLENARKAKYAPVLIGRLTLTPAKVNALSVGIRQIADTSKTILNKVVRRTLLSECLELTQVTVPIGVLLVIFESRPDVLPQIAALSMASGNGLVLKGGEEAELTNAAMMSVVDEALKSVKCEGAVGLVITKEEIADLINMDEYIDLIIPRGSNKLVRFIQDNAKRIPVMGHSEGICHIFIDKDADLKKVIKICLDAKTDYPSACNAVETILMHKDLMEGDIFSELCCILKNAGVKINSGPHLAKMLQFGPPLAKSLKHEYSSLEVCIEVVDNVQQAVDHIHKYGSGHTESIITENKRTAEEFLSKIDSACAYHNCSTRMSDGFRFGLGAEVGVSTGKIHARGPVGIEGLLTTKWLLRGRDHTAGEFNKEGGPKWVHKSLPLEGPSQACSNHDKKCPPPKKTVCDNTPKKNECSSASKSKCPPPDSKKKC